jgi:O-antigen/teichoic acid export membrane protein
VKKSEDHFQSYTGKSIAKNTLFNLLGYGVPLLFAIVIIPFLVKGLGDERFGILNLAWIVIGYFSFFDFGIGRGLTKVISEKIGLNRREEIPDIFWTSFFLMLTVSSIVAVLISLNMASIVDLFKISSDLKTEALLIFYALAFAIPVVSTTAGLRGVLEAYQKFRNINYIRIFLGVFTFLGPLLVLAVIDSLFWIVILMVIVRIFVWILYLLQCFKINVHIKNKVRFNYDSFRPVIKFSIWITLANIVGPIIAYSDRFLIGALVSAVAITYYATPYQVITKLLLIPGSFITVLFPIFSSSSSTNPELTKKLFVKSAKTVFVIIYPAVFIILTFAFELMDIWLGSSFAENSTLVLQFLSIGILMNSISVVPNYFFQGTGKPKVPTLINLIELPFYIVAMLISINNFGIIGAAFTYMVAAAIDAFIMYIMVYKIASLKFWSKYTPVLVLFILISFVIPFLFLAFYLKIVFALVVISVFIPIVWNYLLSSEDKVLIVSKLKLIFNKN